MDNLILKCSISSLLFIIIISSGCSAGSIAADPLIHDIWALESIDGEKVLPDSTIRNLPVIEIYPEEERLHGNTGCNTIDGRIEIDGSKIKFLDLVTTEMACPGDLEKRFLSALQRINNYKIEKLRLHLFVDETEVMVFKKID